MDQIDSLLKEKRCFPPPADFARQAHIRSEAEYEAMYRESIDQPEAFWARMAEPFHWFKLWTRVLDWQLPFAKWFVGAQTNICYNCVDRIVLAGHGNRPAILWEGEPVGPDGTTPAETRTLTFQELREEVCRFANALKSLGVKRGDRVTLYMPLVPELAIAMLACARIGAPHSVIFGGFSAQAIADRVVDADSRIVVTADAGWRRGKPVPLLVNVQAACEKAPIVEQVVVYSRMGGPIPAAGAQLGNSRAVVRHWDALMRAASPECPAEPCDAEDMLYLLYTSGSTGKPKGILHTTAGYMVYTAVTAKYVFDLKPDDIYWCTADIGWVTGHSYVIYGILSNGVPTLMYEGAPNFPDWDRFWSIIERHRVTKFYTAPTAIRAFMREGRAHADRHDLSSLRLLGSVGEPINPEAWMWYHEVIGRSRCPIVDTWWQTETGGIMISPLPGVTATKPGSATRPLFGVDAAILDRAGNPQPANSGGFLCIRKPWPGMLRGIYKDEERYRKQYWSEVPGVYFAGDSARRDPDGYFWIMGRIDDVIKVSGHRLGTMEVESAIVSHPQVAEAAVVAIPHEIKGNAIAAFVTLRTGVQPSTALKQAVAEQVVNQLGALARPDQVRFTQALPKTRSGKIMRRLLREVATRGEVTGDTTTLEDFGALMGLTRPEDEE